MLSVEQKSCLAAFIILTCGSPLHVSSPITFHLTPPRATIQRRNDGGPMSVAESLRSDVANHPNDFVTFETYAGAG